MSLDQSFEFSSSSSSLFLHVRQGGNNFNHSSALSLPTEITLRANSVPQSPCTNDIRSPHSTSSNQGSGSLSSSELALHEYFLRNNTRKYRSKVSSADSLLAMFRNFASSNAGMNLPTSFIISPSSTPPASSPQDELCGDDESSTSSLPTPISFSSNAPDSPVFYRQTTIEVPVLDAHKSSSAQSMLHPPSILLEVPGNINKCLSPIRELPTPSPSPALTPVMPRPRRLQKSPHLHDETISVTISDDDADNVISFHMNFHSFSFPLCSPCKYSYENWQFSHTPPSYKYLSHLSYQDISFLEKEKHSSQKNKIFFFSLYVRYGIIFA